MKEKVIEISAEEIRYLLQGAIHWNDVQAKEKLGARNSAIPPKQNESVPPNAALDKEIGGSPEPETNERSELNHILLGDKVGINTRYLEGTPVVFLLATVGLLTISIWAYFVFAG